MIRLLGASAMCGAALAASLLVHPVLATECTFNQTIRSTDNVFPPEMDFSMYYWKPRENPPEETAAIMADGVIVKNSTANKLKNFLDNFENEHHYSSKGLYMYLQSPGGNLGEGLKLGRIIRAYKLNTAIGTAPQYPMPFDSPETGACLSACTFMFLGGVVRHVHADDIYGVHRFFFDGNAMGTVDSAQQIMGDLLAYVREMGVDQSLVEDMTESGPDKVNHLSVERMQQLHVITSSSLLNGKTASWMSCR